MLGGGSDCGNVALDGNDASLEISRNRGYLGVWQEHWLIDSLAAMRADPTVDFIVAGFHNCTYCSNAFHGSDGGNRDRWLPIFDRFAVDLVVDGHNHCYLRSHPLRGGEPVMDAPAGAVVDSALGTTYLTVRGAGQAEYPTSAHPMSYVSTAGPGYGGIRVPETAEWSSVRTGRSREECPRCTRSTPPPWPPPTLSRGVTVLSIVRKVALLGSAEMANGCRRETEEGVACSSTTRRSPAMTPRSTRRRITTSTS